MVGAPQTVVAVLAVVLALMPSLSVNDLTVKCVSYSNLATVLAYRQGAPFSDVPFGKGWGKEDSLPTLRHLLPPTANPVSPRSLLT
jgi:hypothetical protein